MNWKKFLRKIRSKHGKLALTLLSGLRSSIHILKGGKLEPYFIDLDYITENPKQCTTIAKAISEKVEQIADYRGRKPDFLGFIEKDTIGTVGAIKLSCLISSMTGIPNILVRHTRELPYARVKIREILD